VSQYDATVNALKAAVELPNTHAYWFDGKIAELRPPAVQWDKPIDLAQFGNVVERVKELSAHVVHDQADLIEMQQRGDADELG
jgi:hypothetical protein